MQETHDKLVAHNMSDSLPVDLAALGRPRATAALAQAAEGYQAWDVLDASHMLVASLIVDLVANDDRPNLLRKLDRLLRERVKEIGARQKPRLVV